MQIKEVAKITEILSSLSSTREKIHKIKDFLSKCSKEEIPFVSSFLCGERLYPFKIGYSTLSKALKSLKKYGEGVEVKELFDFMKDIKNLKGEGSKERRLEELVKFLSKGVNKERIIISKYFLGELRFGASKGIILKALSLLFGIEEEKLKIEYAKTGTIFELTENILSGVERNIERLEYFNPLHPMLAQKEENLESATERTGFPVFCEFKIDGIRIIVHRKDEIVKIFSRNLRNLTGELKDFIEEIKSFPCEEFIIDGELFVESLSGEPLPFQDIISILSKVNVLFQIWRTKAFFFDVLKIKDDEIWKKPLKERKEVLKKIVPEDFLIPFIVAQKIEEVEECMEESLKMGHEGLVIKRVDSPYLPGNRAWDWIKVKKFFTLDLVIIGAEWGHGRRIGWLSDYHLGVRKGNKFLMVGKTFKGLTDEEFKEITSSLLKIKKEEKEWGVLVEPKIVVEVAFDEIQKSNKYESGFSLRFARIKRIRWDKNPEECDDFESLVKIFEIFRKRKGSSF